MRRRFREVREIKEIKEIRNEESQVVSFPDLFDQHYQKEKLDSLNLNFLENGNCIVIAEPISLRDIERNSEDMYHPENEDELRRVMEFWNW